MTENKMMPEPNSRNVIPINATANVPKISQNLSSRIIGTVLDLLIPKLFFNIIDFINSPDFTGLIAKANPDKNTNKFSFVLI